MLEDQSKKLHWKVWKQFFQSYIWPFKHLFLPLAISTVIVGGCDALFTLVTRNVIDEVVSKGKDADFLTPGIAYLVLTLLLTFFVRKFILYAGEISVSMSHRIREEGFTHLQKLPFSFYDKHSVGWLMARMTSDCNTLSRLIAWGSVEMFWGIPFLLGISIVMLVLNWKVALIVLVVIPPLIIFSTYFQKLLLGSSRRVRKANSKLTSAYNEGIDGARTSKTLVREQENLDEFKGLTSEMENYSMQRALQTAAYLPTVMVFGSIGAGLALWFGGIEVLAGIMTVGTLVAFMAYTRQFFEPVVEMSRVMGEFQYAQASVERVMGLISAPVEIQDSPQVLEKIAQQKNLPAKEGVAIDGEAEHIDTIEFKNVSFAYVEGEPVLKNLNLKVQAGQSVALVGATGGGKSTVVSLLCRFYEPTEGEILINGVDYRERSLDWFQSNMGIVLQTPHLFSGSVLENIRYGNLEASDEEVIQASKIVKAHDFILEMEEGYNTEVGEGGGKLSSGQKQLVSFARAILADPQLFVMDEATSSVDPYTEHLLQEGLNEILKGRFSFIIAHRLSTIRSADLIVVVRDGEVQEKGSHEQLLQLNGIYADLYNKQFSGQKGLGLAS